ncbi:MAG: aminotransferase class V-fold PLP-dependent enzyme [Phaeodactylibacter sp.]|nr:aminotransferase class V-fold PLP-dependent enzyme [Phaeodactylibacter sp.]MCB9297503.1 aminotransferase class V-fold PLP-dependent enzyme [Lewinellaceae bacterium]
MKFDKSNALFTSREEATFIGHCSISPLYSKAADIAVELLRAHQQRGGAPLIEAYMEQLNELKAHAAALLHTQPENIAFVKNTSDALSMVANGYPFEPGDEVVTFVQEYPANFHPWRLQERTRGVELKLLSSRPAREDIPPEVVGGWSMEELESLITPKTRVVALSHVQFTSGYAANLRELGQLCRERGIDLVIDAAQSLGVQPIYPEEMNIAAVASAGWKWLLGPMGTGILYTSPEFREKLRPVQVGAEAMVQEFDFMNLEWNPVATARRFEFSTSPVYLVAALATCLRDIHARYGADAIFKEVIRLQEIFLDKLDNPGLRPLLFGPEHRSGILSIHCENLKSATAKLAENKIVCAPRSGLLRVAPHFYNTEEDMVRLADVLNGVTGPGK